MLAYVFASHRLLSPHVDKDDPVWKCWEMHCYYVTYACKSSFTWDEICHLNCAITEQHRLYESIWPDNIIPKYHYVLHMPLDIWLCGPPKSISCMRLEAVHQYWKHLVPSMNFNGDVLSTLAKRRGRYTALKMYLDEPMQPVQHMGEIIRTDIRGTQMLVAVAKLTYFVNFTSSDIAVPCTMHTKWKVAGRYIKEGSTVAYNSEQGGISIGVVEVLLEINGCHLLIHRTYESGVFACDGRKVIRLSSIAQNLTAVEINTHDLTVVHAIESSIKSDLDLCVVQC